MIEGAKLNLAFLYFLLHREASLQNDAAISVALVAGFAGEEKAPGQNADAEEEEPAAQARELALGLSIVRDLHTSRVGALDGEAERKLRWDLLLMGALSFEVRSRMTGSFRDGKSIARLRWAYSLLVL